VSRPITLLRLRVPGSSPVSTPALTVHRARVLQYVHGKIIARRSPRPSGATEAAPPAGSSMTPTISARMTTS
jgi:hypothetical protein